METLFQDLRQAARTIAYKPGFSAVVVLTLALGIGANSAIFSVVHAVLLRELPYQDPADLVLVWEHNRPRQRLRNSVSSQNYLDWRERSRSFAQMGAATPDEVNLSGTGEPERVSAARATAGLFSTLGVRAGQGRTFEPAEEKDGADSVVLLSDGLWQRRFGGDPGILGRTVSVNGLPRTVVGVLSPRTEFPPGAELWVPLTDRVLRESGGRFLAVVARLKPGITRDQAQADMSTVAAQLEREHADRNAGWGANVVPMREQFVGDVRLALLMLLAAAGFVLLIACANVGALQMARALGRRHELAVRAALGAGRGRLARQLLTESVLLALVGGGVGVMAAVWGVAGLGRLLPPQATSLIDLRVNAPVLAFTALLSLASGVLFGIVPALRAAASDPQASLREDGRAAGQGRGRRRLGDVLVVAEIALALTLLVGAGLMLRSFHRLQTVDAGFRAEGVLTLEVSVAGSRYGEGGAQARFFSEAVERVRRLTGVRAAGAVSVLPLGAPVMGGPGRSISARGMATSILIEGQPPPAPADRPTADIRAVTPGYFEALGIPLRRGRFLDESDRERPAGEDAKTGGSGRVVISESMARRFWPGADPIGQHVLVSMRDWTRAEVVGVVGDVRLAALDTEPRAAIYWPLRQFPVSSMALVASTDGDPLALAGAVRAQIASLDPQQPVTRVRTLEQVVTDSLQQPRFGARLLGLFAAVGVLLAALGVYGLLADRVAARGREFGVRMALGADRGRITASVLKQGLGLTLAGIVVGLAGGAALSRVLSRLLFRPPALDPWTFAVVPLVLFGAALIASYLPARRAARLDPVVVLRGE